VPQRGQKKKKRKSIVPLSIQQQEVTEKSLPQNLAVPCHNGKKKKETAGVGFWGFGLKARGVGREIKLRLGKLKEYKGVERGESVFLKKGRNQAS